MREAAKHCPCDSGQPYSRCCGPLHAGAAAPSAEALMRSRYSAFVLGRADYLLETWHASTRPATLALDGAIRWLGLAIKARRSTGEHTAEVEFVARSRRGGERAERLHERSRFVQEQGRWFYVDGRIDPS